MTLNLPLGNKASLSLSYSVEKIFMGLNMKKHSMNWRHCLCLGVSLFSLVGLVQCSAQVPIESIQTKTADLCLHNMTIYTGESDTALAGQITVSNGMIQSITPSLTSHNVNCKIYENTTTQILDLSGAFLYPGFVDAHAHLLGIGLRELTLNLEGTKSIKSLQSIIKQEAKTTPIGTTIFGRGWIETHWPENRFPTRQDLDAAAPDHAVILERADGHAFVVNSKALSMAKIDANTKPPFGGDILIGKDGQPSGMLIDKAQSLVAGLLPKLDSDRIKKAFIKAGQVYSAAGWTGVHSMSFDASNISLLENLSDRNLVSLRVTPMLDMKNAKNILAKIQTNGEQSNENGRVRTRGIKLYMDGALGSRGAALLAPYADDSDNVGLLLSKKDDVMPVFINALRHGIQISTHAIGDRANRLVLDWYEEAFAAVPIAERKTANPRWRIEHSQIIDPIDIKRFAALGVIASMQPSHAIGDLHFAPSRLGDNRLVGGYAWNSLLNSGAIVVGGSDAPVERGDPRIEFYAAVARQDMMGFSAPNWQAHEKITRAQALTLFTSAPAYANFSEDRAGLVKVGLQADFTVFSKDIMTIPASDILTVETVLTLIDGKIAHQR